MGKIMIAEEEVQRALMGLLQSGQDRDRAAARALRVDCANALVPWPALYFSPSQALKIVHGAVASNVRDALERRQAAPSLDEILTKVRAYGIDLAMAHAALDTTLVHHREALRFISAVLSPERAAPIVRSEAHALGADDVEMIAQQALETATVGDRPALRRYRGDSRLTTFLEAVLRLCTRQYLSVQQRGRKPPPLEPPDETVLPLGTSVLPAPVLAALKTPLTPWDRIALRDRFLREMTYEEMAKRLHLSIGAVHARVQRALLRLRSSVKRRRLSRSDFGSGVTIFRSLLGSSSSRLRPPTSSEKKI